MCLCATADPVCTVVVHGVSIAVGMAQIFSGSLQVQPSVLVRLGAALRCHCILYWCICAAAVAPVRTNGFRHCLAALFSGMRGGSGGGCHGLNVIQGGGGGTWEGERLHLQLLLCQACIRCSSLGRGSFQTRCFQGCGGEASFPKKSASTQHGEGTRAQQ